MREAETAVVEVQLAAPSTNLVRIACLEDFVNVKGSVQMKRKHMKKPLSMDLSLP